MSATMEAAEIDAFLTSTAPALVACVSSVRRDGSPDARPVWYRWDSATFQLWSDASFSWVRRLAVDPRLSLAVFEHALPHRAVYVRGRARVRLAPCAEMADVVAPIVARYVRADRVRALIRSYDRGTDKALITLQPETIRGIVNLPDIGPASTQTEELRP